MIKRGVKLFTIVSVIMIFLITVSSVYAKNDNNGNNNNGHKQETKRVLVKYRNNDSRRDEKLKEQKSKQKVAKYNRVNKKNLYVIELDETEIVTLKQDREIELVEDDSIIKLLSNEYHACQECSDIQIYSEISGEDKENTHAEHIHMEETAYEVYPPQGICLLCGQSACNSEEECMDPTHYICNDCIREMIGDIPLEDVTTEDGEGDTCDCSQQDSECTCGDLCGDENCCVDCTCENEESFWKDYVPCCDICSIECVNGPCCDDCIYGDIYYQRYEIFKNEVVHEQVKELDTGYDSIYSQLGDKIYWNILRTKSNLLHDKNITGRGIKVAVFDTGIDLNHNELSVAGGISFVEGVTSYNDDNGHGTAMAGIIAAGLNGQGIAGIAPDVELYSVKVLDKDGMGRYSYIIQGIEWAIANGINVISLSLGSNQYSQILEEAINLAVENNILIVAAAGNGGANNIMYPAAYPQVICVGATNGNNTLATFSNYGFQLDLVAPGTSIVTTGRNNTEVTIDGTSPATQHVAGMAALLWSADRNLSNGHIKYLLYKNANVLGEYNLYGHGLPDAEVAYKNLESRDYSIYVDDMGEGTYIEGLVDVGWDGVVYGQAACKHNIVQLSYTAPTCTKDGYLARGCNKCGYIEYAGSVPKLGHSNSTTTQAATCTSDGYTETKCTKCGYISNRKTLTKLGHNYVYQNTTAPTCTGKGSANFKCSRCSSTRSDPIPAMGHSAGTPQTTAAGCETKGYTVTKCTRCGYEMSRGEIPPTGHSWMPNGTVDSTCTDYGYNYFKCRNCTLTRSERIEKKKHVYSPKKIDAACKSQGYTRYECSCGDSYNTDYNGPLGHNWSTKTKYATCTEAGYELTECSGCPEYTLKVYPELGHNYSSYVSPTHESNGHYWSSGCSRCSYGSGSGHQTLSGCLSCTTAPSISFANMSGSTVFCETDTIFKPQIKVFDNENDTLTCKYHLNGSSAAADTITVTGTKPEKTVAFKKGFNAASLSEGSHTIKATAKDSVAPMGETTITFKVDKSAPTISNLTVAPSTNNVKFTITASDSISGLSSTAYRYTVNDVATGWLASGTYTAAELTPNTSYNYIVEVRDNKNHIATKTGTFSTKVETPVVTATAVHDNTLHIVIRDNNPVTTQYRVKAGSGYVNADGSIASSESWITIPYDAGVSGKKIAVSNLSPNTSYTITVSARNAAATETVTAANVSAVTSPAAPVNIAVASVTHEQISLQWQTVAGAVQYEVYREAVNEQGNVTDTYSKAVSTNYIYDNNVLPNQNYQYKIRSMNQAGIHGLWSTPILNTRTLPTPPEKVGTIVSEAEGAVLSISWNEIDGAVGYKVEISYDGNIESLYTRDNHITFDTNTNDCQCTIKVRAFNQRKEDEPDNTVYWSNEGEWSEAVTLYTPADTPTIQSIVPDKITPSSVTVSWKVNNNPSSVRYLLGITRDNMSVREIQVAGAAIENNIITYQVTGLSPETLYGFKVKAINSVGKETDWSNQEEAATLMDYPGIPARLRATAKSDRITLSWDASNHSQSYQIEKDGNIIERNCIETYYIDSNVQPDTVYSYRVKAANATGESDWSQSLDKKTLGQVPSSPTVSIVTGSAISVTIEWFSSEDVTGYEIEADGHIYNMGMNTVFEHNGLVPGTVHTYAVRSRSVNGKGEWSNYITYKTKPLVPDIPVILQVIPSESQAAIYWNAVIDTSYYEIEIDGTIAGITPSLGYQHEFLDNTDAEHMVRVRAVNESGAGNFSAPYPIRLLNEGGGDIPVVPVPATPELVCNVTGPAIILLDWNPVQDATYYQLEADGEIIYTGGETRYIHTGFAPGQHQYRIRAGNLSGDSQWSEPVIIFAGLPNSTAPGNISYYRIDDNTTKLVWDSPAHVEEYIIEINGTVSEGKLTEANTTIHTEPGTIYNVRIASVRVHDGAETYDWSEEITFRTSGRLPEVPDNVVAEASADTIMLSWEAVSEAQGYEVYSSTGIIDTGDNLSCVMSGLESSGTYLLKVRAYNEAGFGEWSREISIMTKDEIPGVPVNIRYSSYQSAGAVTGSAIRLEWDGVQEADSYEIEDMDGRVYTTDTNHIIIGGLMAGNTYQLRIRAITGDSAGAWSSRISVIPITPAPDNVNIDIETDKIKVSWAQVSVGDIYEIEIDGVIVATTDNLFYEFDYKTFYMQRSVRVRALRDGTPGKWSKAVEFSHRLPVTVDSYTGEIFSVVLPAVNVEISNYRLTLTYNQDEAELVDACEMTREAERTSSYIEEYDMYIIFEKDGNTESITFIAGDKPGLSYTGIVNSIRLKSKVTSEITLHYGATLR